MIETDRIQEGRGRSAKKRAAKAVEELARQLVELPDARLAGLSLPEALRQELELARTAKGHSARKRQLKYLAGLLRRDDALREELAAALARQGLEQRKDLLAFHHLEDLRDRLCSAATFDAALDELRDRYPLLDTGKMTRLARSVHATGDKKSSREIFRRLRKAEEQRAVEE